MADISERNSLKRSLLNTQRALVGVITPNLRAVIIKIDHKEELFYSYYYYEGELSEELLDLWQCATAEATADFWGMTEEHFVRLDYPKEIPLGDGNFAYLRKEPFLPKSFGQKIVYNPSFNYGTVKLALLSALLGKITPQIRAICVETELTTKKSVVYFYHEGTLEKETKKISQEVIEEAGQTLTEFNALIERQFERQDYQGQRLKDEKGIYIYRRKESYP